MPYIRTYIRTLSPTVGNLIDARVRKSEPLITSIEQMIRKYLVEGFTIC